MFGGGDVSLQDILRQVSQELENEGNARDIRRSFRVRFWR